MIHRALEIYAATVAARVCARATRDAASHGAIAGRLRFGAARPARAAMLVAGDLRLAAVARVAIAVLVSRTTAQNSANTSATSHFSVVESARVAARTTVRDVALQILASSVAARRAVRADKHIHGRGVCSANVFARMPRVRKGAGAQ